MKYFVNCIKEYPNLKTDIKQLIPEMNVRRRMSKLLKMGVCTALESLIDFEQTSEIDAIITASSLGAIADSERFFTTLNPVAFIQSTPNTIGGQIALIRNKKCYNNTFVHRNNSFESALLEAMLRLKLGRSKAVLLGIFDEATLVTEKVLQRLNILKDKTLGEGAIFFVLTSEQVECSVAEIELEFDTEYPNTVLVSQENNTYWSGAVAELLTSTIEQRKDVTISNDLNTTMRSVIKIKSL